MNRGYEAGIRQPGPYLSCVTQGEYLNFIKVSVFLVFNGKDNSTYPHLVVLKLDNACKIHSIVAGMLQAFSKCWIILLLPGS